MNNKIALDALKLAYIAMQHMGNVLNNIDAVDEDEDAQHDAAFEAVRAAIAALQAEPPKQPGEYPPLPEAMANPNCAYYDAKQMRAYVDADRAAAQAEPPNVSLAAVNLMRLTGLSKRIAVEVARRSFGLEADASLDAEVVQAEPAGFVRVPVEPTLAMIKCALDDCGGMGRGSCGEHVGIDGSDMRSVWESMLAAAPKEPTK